MASEDGIHAVGHHLQTHAHGLGAGRGDAYARSAFNRYYYSVFLKTRDLFRTINPSWSRLSHADYPGTLRGAVRKQLKSAWTRARRDGDTKLVKDTESALRAVDALSNLLEEAYAIRVVADYNPEEEVDFQGGGRFSLKEVEITSAHGWRPKCDTFCKAIYSAWVQING